MATQVVFIVNLLRQARCIRRINDFIDRGYSVKVYGFDRAGDSRQTPNFQYTVLDIIDNKTSYSSRLVMMVQCIRQVIKNEPSNSLFYLFNLDVALASTLTFKRFKYCYEISDLMELEQSNLFLLKALTGVNRFLMSRSKVNVFTSEGFLKYYYPKKELAKNVVLSNKLNRNCLQLPFPPESEFNPSNIKFSFTGALRGESLFRFVKVISDMNMHEIHLYGIFSDDKMEPLFKDILNKSGNVFYHGPFKNPADFPDIYKNNNIVICYYYSNKNDVYLEPNKLFEAIFYEKPIVVSNNTFLGDKVRELNVGYVIDGDTEEKIKSFIDQITIENYKEKVLAERRIPKDDSVDNPDLLFKTIQSLNLFQKELR